MRKQLAAAVSMTAFGSFVGCGFFGGPSQSAGNSNIVLLQVRAVTPTNTNGVVNTSAISVNYTYGSYNINQNGGISSTNPTSTGSTGYDSAGAGNFGVSTPTTPTSSNAVSVGWQSLSDSTCPASLNPGGYTFINASYTAYQQGTTIYCQGASATSLSQTTANENNFPSQLTFTTNYAVPTAYGTPRVVVYDAYGNNVGNASGVSVSAAQTTVTFSTSVIPVPQSPDGNAYDSGPQTIYAIGLLSVNSDGSTTEQGGATFATRYLAAKCTKGSCGT